MKVDKDIFALGVFYVLVMAVYILFEFVVINRRPVLINGYLEASYPSSTTLLVACVMPTAAVQFCRRIRLHSVRVVATLLTIGFTFFMVVGRFISGVHWLSDIFGGLLFSAGVVLVYVGAIKAFA